MKIMEKYNKSVEKSHSPNRSYISDYPYRILVIGGSGSGKNIELLNLIKNQ